MRCLTRRWKGQFAARMGRGAVLLLLLFWLCPAIVLHQTASAADQTVDNLPVSVRLTVKSERVIVAVPPSARTLSVVKADTGETTAVPGIGRSLSVHTDGLYLFIDGKNTGTSKVVVESSGEVIVVNGSRYRGRIEVEVALRGLMVANVLPLRWYLASVLGAEMPDKAPLEALKAQSVVSRSYVLHRMMADDAPYPPVCDSIFSQVYKGQSTESSAAIRAVRETKGLVLTYSGDPIDACFSASSGGYTASAKDVWGNEVPYMIGKSDPFSVGGEYGEWELELTSDECERLLLKAGHEVGELLEIVVIKVDKSGRACRAALLGSTGEVLMRGTDLRLCFGTRRLRSTMFDVERTPRGFAFFGKGYGHGVGLSQEGACRMARAGYSFGHILHFYYTGVSLKRHSVNLKRQLR